MKYFYSFYALNLIQVRILGSLEALLVMDIRHYQIRKVQQMCFHKD